MPSNSSEPNNPNEPVPNQPQYPFNRSTLHHPNIRDDAPDITWKAAQRVFPCDQNMVLILDDRKDVWPSSNDSIVKAEPFYYFHGMKVGE